MSTEGKKYPRKQFAFSGEWNPTDDPLIIGEENYSELENYCYRKRNGVGLEAVKGYTKINTTSMSTTPGTYYKGRSGIQLRSPHTQKTRVLVQAQNVTEDESAVFENLTEIPDQGNFENNLLHIDASGAGLGRFAKWPGGHIAYFNGKEAKVYAGDEKECNAFIASTAAIDDEVDDAIDYSEAVRNTLNTPSHVAIIGGGVDSYTKLLLHCDGDDASTTFADDGDTGHNPVAQGNAQLDTDQSKFGPSAGLFDGAGDFVYVPDHADWYMGTGAFTIDFWVRFNNLPTSLGSMGFFNQYDDSTHCAYAWIQHMGGYNYRIYFLVDDAVGGGGAGLLYNVSGLNTNQWYHLAFIRGWDNDTDEWMVTLDGTAMGNAFTFGSGYPWPNMTANFEIGRDNSVSLNYFDGWIDEFRVSKGIARWVNNFTPPIKAYGTKRHNWIVGSTRPLQGVKIYVSSPNTETSTLTVKEWNGNSWSTLTTTDNTASGGVSLSQTGTVTWTHTKNSSKVKLLENLLLYWYQFELSAGEAEVYHATLDAGWQDICDIWDGLFRVVGRLRFKSGTDELDGTLHVNTETPAGVDAAGSYTVDVGGLASTDWIEIGLAERTCALYIKMFEGESGKVNSNAAVMTMEYWNSEGWKSVSGFFDGTSDSGNTLAKSGFVTWDYPGGGQEVQKNVYGAKLYYYRIKVSAALSATVLIDVVQGIPAPANPNPIYKFPFMFRSRPMLCGAIGEKEGNRVDFGITGSTEGFNGVDSSFGLSPLYFGGSEELTCACELYNRFGANIYHMGVFCKEIETYLLTGYDAETYTIRKISGSEGCPAPLTMDTVEMNYGMTEGVVRNVAAWLSYNGPYLFDAGVLEPITKNIACYFDKSDPRCINFDAIDRCRGWMDPDNLVYNLGLCSGASQTEINVWVCYDLVLKRWYLTKPAGTDAYPRVAIRVTDENGAQYVYGFRDNGYMMRLENGANWDGGNMVQKVVTADQMPAKDIWEYTAIHHFKLLCESISESVSITGKHYSDGKSTGSDLRSIAADGANRYVRNTQKIDKNGYSHKFELQVTTSNTVKGVPLIAWGYTYEKIREDQ